MKEALQELHDKVADALDQIVPGGRQVFTERLQVTFDAWAEKTPEFPLHQGLPKLVAEFYLRARDPKLKGITFFRARNAVLDSLEKEFGDLRLVSQLDGAKLKALAPDIAAIYQAHAVAGSE